MCRLGWACVLCPSQVRVTQATRCLLSAHSPGVVHLMASPAPAAQFPGWAVGVPSQVHCVSLLGSWSLAATLLVDVNSPGSQEDLVSNWEPAHSLVRECHLWGLDCTFPAGCCPPAFLPLAGDGLLCCRLTLFWYSLSPLFCEQGQQCLRLGLFVGNFSLSLFFSLSFWLSHSLACYLTLAPSECPQGIQAWSLP